MAQKADKQKREQQRKFMSTHSLIYIDPIWQLITIALHAGANNPRQ